MSSKITAAPKTQFILKLKVIRISQITIYINITPANIRHIFSPIKHPQSNGCCEAIYKEIKKYLLDDLNKKRKF